MKVRTLFALLVLSLAITTATAQKDKHFEIGLQGGYGSTWIINQSNYGLPEMDYDYFFGPGYNFQVGYNFNSIIGVFAEIGSVTIGQKYFDTWAGNEYGFLWTGDADIERKVELNYLSVPVFFKYSYGESRARFRLLVGPEFLFMQKAEQEYTYDGNDMAGEREMLNPISGELFDPAAKDITDRYNDMDVAVTLDLGADIFIIEEMLYLSVAGRFSYGLTDINADDYQIPNQDNNYDPSHTGRLTGYFGIHYIIAGKNLSK